MKLSGRDADRFFSAPDANLAGALIYGPDPLLNTARRKALLRAILGADAEADFRLTQIDATEVRKTPGALIDSLRCASFFSGKRAVLIDGATDVAAKAIEPAIASAEAGDAFLLVVAGALKPASSLRKLFEASRLAIAAAVYPPSTTLATIREDLRAAGINADDGALRDLAARTQDIDWGAYRQLILKLSLYKLGDSEILSIEDIAACAPLCADAELDALSKAAADGNVEKAPGILARLINQGVAPTSACIALSRYFMQMHEILSLAEHGNLDSAIGGLRPPLFGPRRQSMTAHCRRWNLPRIEQALRALRETDAALRSSSSSPANAVIERALIRVAMLGAR